MTFGGMLQVFVSPGPTPRRPSAFQPEPRWRTCLEGGGLQDHADEEM